MDANQTQLMLVLSTLSAEQPKGFIQSAKQLNVMPPLKATNC